MKIYLLTGSNIGDSLSHLKLSADLISQKTGTIIQRSSVYKTEPWGNKDQHYFLNQVLLIETTYEPEEVLQQLLTIEQVMGRNRIEKWGPRVIDIDILFYEDLIIQSQRLTVPHPLLHERRFTLKPLAEIAPDFVHPVLHKSISTLMNECNDHSVVEKM